MAKQRRIVSTTHLEILVGLAMEKTQADIAAELQLEQPAISKQLSLLQKATGNSLVYRDGHRLRLTAAGREIADSAKGALLLLDEIESKIGGPRAEDDVPVRVVACSTPGAYVLPSVVGEFMQALPGAKVELGVCRLTELWIAFRSGMHDFAVIPYDVMPDDLSGELLYDDPLVVFANPTHRLAMSERVTVADLLEETLIARFSGETTFWQRVFSGHSAKQLKRVNQVQVASFEGVKRMVETGLGVGVLFESTVGREITVGQFRRLNLVGTSLARPFGLVQARSARSPRAEQFRAFLLDHFSAHGTAVRSA